eukprot:CAMPEP_0170418938 /NCGR_PEP_ID=MMETSP0117_2-20130122/34533_1 /TAXON_ID=400756 /ORGANISM="Durinskia baltica, Strain CSIRO CS-38" /LENGTH=101 /DNA_ID=CAMNT_0010677257 /DNA_START=394 /DNA_END=699 /DNA_ORIENTATION=+
MGSNESHVHVNFPIAMKPEAVQHFPLSSVSFQARTQADVPQSVMEVTTLVVPTKLNTIMPARNRRASKWRRRLSLLGKELWNELISPREMLKDLEENLSSF